jgi:hypothetical protein
MIAYNCKDKSTRPSCGQVSFYPKNQPVSHWGALFPHNYCMNLDKICRFAKRICALFDQAAFDDRSTAHQGQRMSDQQCPQEIENACTYPTFLGRAIAGMHTRNVQCRAPRLQRPHSNRFLKFIFSISNQMDSGHNILIINYLQSIISYFFRLSTKGTTETWIGGLGLPPYI